jgi:hypothetical protein
MRLAIVELHPAKSSSVLNDEWFIVENVGDKPFSTSGCSLSVGRSAGKPLRLRQIGTLDPGFTILPNEKVRVITGNPGKKAHGTPPSEEGLKNYHLFLASPVIAGPGTVLALALRQHEVARATFDPKSQSGVLSQQNGHAQPQG